MTGEELYCCRACRYVFPASAFPARCPDCEKETWRGSSIYTATLPLSVIAYP